MKKRKRKLFRDKLGRFIKKKKIKPKPKKIIKKKIIKKRRKPKIKFVKAKPYQTQIDKFAETHTTKFYRILPFEEIENGKKFVQSFKEFYKEIKRPKKATDVKFGVIAEDIESGEYISRYSSWTDLIFDKKAIKRLFDQIYDWVNALEELAERYLVNIKEAIITEIIMFKSKGHL